MILGKGIVPAFKRVKEKKTLSLDYKNKNINYYIILYY